jgi:hypothetical protein
VFRQRPAAQYNFPRRRLDQGARGRSLFGERFSAVGLHPWWMFAAPVGIGIGHVE